MCRCFKFLPTCSLVILACWPLSSLACEPNLEAEIDVPSQAAEGETTEPQLPAWAFTGVESSVSVPDGGTVLISGGLRRSSPQGTDCESSLPCAQPLPPVQAASSRRQWLSLARLPATGEPDDAELATVEMTLVNDVGVAQENEALHIYPAQQAAHQRLKRWLIESQNSGIRYNCEQSNCEQAGQSGGPNLLPPQQAQPLPGIAEDSSELLDLASDEPAKVILDIREQVGPKLLEGTIFGDGGWRARTPGEHKSMGQRAILVRCIRDMELSGEPVAGQCPASCATNCAATCTAACAANCADQCADACDEPCENHCEFAGPAHCSSAASLAVSAPAGPVSAASASVGATSTSPDAVPALRQACRQLDQAAELLEEQKLYDRADQLRSVAQQLREEARQADATGSAVRIAQRK